MKKKTGLLILSFLVFYAMIHLGRYLPDLVNGKFSLVDERSKAIRLLSLMLETAIAFLFTWTAYLSLHRFYPNKKLFQLLIALTGFFITCFFLQYIAAKSLSADPVRIARFFRNEILYDGFYLVFAMVFYFIRYSQHTELQQKELSLQNRNAELSFLRSQINPHFLFNNLNNIYSLVYHQSEQSLNAISGLSELLRYMLYDQSETITLQKEIQYLNQYIELEQLRFEQPSRIDFNWKEANPKAKLAPLLLLPFIENAFKHGAISYNQVWLKIALSTTPKGEINLQCSNQVGNKRKDATGGIGIANVKKRLELLYPDNHRLDISEKDNEFSVSLQIGTINSDHNANRQQ